MGDGFVSLIHEFTCLGTVTVVEVEWAVQAGSFKIK